MNSQNSRQLNEVYSIYDDALLGKGSTGNVYVGCVNNNPNHRVAIKCINLHEINNEVTRYLLSCEIAALSNLGKLENTQHDNIVRLHQIIIIDNHIYLVMELLEGGTLADYIKKNPNGLPEQEALCILKQILEGYKRIKDKQIVHRDLKPDNILFKSTQDQNKRVAIIDFGYCEMKEVPSKPKMFYNVGSPKYMSPEAYKENRYSEKSDMWSIGVMLYQMLVGKTCDNGMTMNNYLQMLQTTGIPLPERLKNIHKHLLTSMLAYDHKTRIQCDQALRVLSLHQNPMGRPSTQLSIPYKSQSLRATLDINPSERPNRNNPIFYSALLPTKVGPTFNNSPIQQPFHMMGLPRNQSGFSQHNENFHRMGGQVRYPSTSFHNDGNNFKRVVLPQRIDKIQNVQFYSVKQIIQRKHPENHLAQLKNSNMSPFSKQHIQFPQHQHSQNFRQPPLHVPRTAMNQIVNQDIKVNSFPSQLRIPVQSTPKKQLTFSTNVNESVPQQIHMLQFNNVNPKVHINHFQIGRVREVQNFAESPQLKKNISQQVHFVGYNHFQRNNPNFRQSQQFGRSYITQNKIHINSQHRTNNDLTLTRHPYPHMTQSVNPRYDLTMTRVAQHERHQNNINNTDLTQTRIPIQLMQNDFTLNKAQRVSAELNMFHKQIPNHLASQGLNHKNDFFSQRVIMNKIPNKPVQAVREMIPLKPQISTIRNIESKIHYVKANPFPQTLNRQQPQLVMIRSGIVK